MPSLRIRQKKKPEKAIENVPGVMFLSLPFIERLQLIQIMNTALDACEIQEEKWQTYAPIDILMTLLLGFLLKCDSFDKIHARLEGDDNKDYGTWIGKKRLSSIRQIKRRLQPLVIPAFVEKLKSLLAESVAKAGIVDLGVVYIDAHFIAYYGKENISKGYSTIRRLAIKGVYHHFAGDQNGRPIMFCLTNGSVRLKRTLPMLLHDLKQLRAEYDPDRPLFLVFDREIYDAKLFTWLDKEEVVFLTYMKNAPDYSDDVFFPPINITVRFRTKIKSYQLFATYNPISGYHSRVKTLVIRDPETGRKSVIITNCDRIKFKDRAIRPRNETLASYMVNRWGQENFFSRAVNEIGIDHHFGYQIETCVPQPMVDNPKIQELQKKLARYKIDLEKTQSKIASALLKENKPISLDNLAQSDKKFKQLLEDRLLLVENIDHCQHQINCLPKKALYTSSLQISFFLAL